MRKLLIVGALSLALISGSRASQGSSASTETHLEVVRLLHEGRFDEADQGIPADDSSLRAAFLRAFVTYWRLLFDDENPALRSRLEDQLDQTIVVGRARLRLDPSEGESQVWTGSARLLRAQLYASMKKPLKAAFEAKRAKRLLEGALDADGGPVEAYFGLGTYNYYASRVSALVKGIRFLLALPRGNRKLGLAQLTRASRESRYFSLEAQILLVTIYSGKHERHFTQAIRQVELAMRRQPRSVAVLNAASLLELSLARPWQAAVHLDEALARAARAPRTDPSVVARLRYHRARAEMALFRPDLALEQLRPLLEGLVPGPVSMAGDLDALVSRATSWTEPPDWLQDGTMHAQPKLIGLRRALARAGPALELEREGDLDGAARALLELSEEEPSDPALALLTGRALLLSDRGPEALEWLARAERAPALPEAWVGPCRLMVGQAADLAGERKRAMAYYRKALESSPFTGKNAAHHHREEPFGPVESLHRSSNGLDF